jgi:hypothetical protein
MSITVEDPDARDRAGDGAPGADPYAGCPTVEVMAAGQQLAALMWATQAELLGLVRDLAGRPWPQDGCRDVVEWLQLRCGLLASTAREWVRVAEALQDLPAIAGVFATGAVSWDQVRHAVRFAVPGTDAVVADELGRWSAEQVAEVAREHKARDEDDDREAERRRRVRFRNDHKRGGVWINGWLPFADAEPLRVGLERDAERLGPDPATGLWDALECRMADALVTLGAAGLAADGDLDRATVVVHVDHDILHGHAEGNATTEGGSWISAESARRLACDGHVEWVIEGPDGAPVGIGRRSRTIPRWLRRLVRKRDRRCRCCGGPIHQIHHLVFWEHLGPTDLDNLVGLCWGCHRRVHEGGWTITGQPDSTLVFRDPYGATVTSDRQPLAADIRRRAERLAGVCLHADRRTDPGGHDAAEHGESAAEPDPLDHDDGPPGQRAHRPSSRTAPPPTGSRVRPDPPRPPPGP